MLVSSMAALDGNTGLSIGNAIGSNITNVGLMLGITALFYPLISIQNCLNAKCQYYLLIHGIKLLLSGINSLV